MATILLAVRGMAAEPWFARLRQRGSRHDVRLWPQAGDPARVDYACVWQPPHGMLAQFPNLKAIFSLGAGVDHLLADPALPAAPIVRIVDPDLTVRMTGYVVLHALLHQRRLKTYEAQRHQRLWREHDEPPATMVRAGIMGMGELGRAAARGLAAVGFPVLGWSRTAREAADIEVVAGEAALAGFLARSNILVCLLPLTAATAGILNYELFRRLARAPIAPVLINAGRGGQQVEADILRALDDGTLGGASLDVFETEPLPAASPLWDHPKIYLTPHNAAPSDPRPLVDNIMAQIERFERGGKLENIADRGLGY